MASTSDFVPKRRKIVGVTNAVNAEVTTDVPHGYQTGMVVRVVVPESHIMFLYEQTIIVVTGETTFLTEIDTTGEPPFVEPIFLGAAFTDAQAVPMTGVTDNIAGDR